jgi:hypothetical protein
MELFVHGGREHPLRRIEVDETVTVAVVLKEHGIDGGAFWREGHEGPIAEGVVLVEAGVTEGERVYVGKCKRIKATVNFGEDSKVHELPPSATCGSLFEWAVGPQAFNLPESERVKHALALCDTEDIVDRSAHVGEFVDADCEACFDLVPKERHEG